MIMGMKIGENIYNLRKAKNITQEELAHLLDVSRQSVSLWETDQTVPSIENLLAMCKIFEVTMDELCNNPLEQKPEETQQPERKDFIAHGVTVLDKDNFRLFQKFFYRKIVVGFIAGIILSIIFAIYVIIQKETVYIFIPIILFAISVSVLITHYLKIKRELKQYTSEDKTMEFWFYKDNFELYAKTQSLKANYYIKYNELTVADKDNYLFLFWGRYAILDKTTLEGDVEEVISRIKFCSKKYKSSVEKIENTEKKLSEKKIVILKIILPILLIFSYASLFSALATAAVLSKEVLIVKNMWVMYLFLPIPLSSIVLGVYATKRGLRKKWNIVIGIIFSSLLILCCLFSIFGTMYTSDYSYVEKVGQKISFELPETGYISTQHHSKNQKSIDPVFLYYSSDVDFLSQTEIAKFEQAIAESELWTNKVGEKKFDRYI